jgi:FkbM family methyltransferase
MNLDVDFSCHPAFTGMLNSSQINAGEYRKLITEMDAHRDEIFRPGSRWPTLAERWAEFDSRAQPMRKRFDRLVDADSSIDAALVPFLKKGFRLGVKDYAEDAELLITRLNPSFPLSEEAMKQGHFLHEQGYLEFHMPKRWLDPLREFLKDDIESLRRRIPTCEGKLLSTEPGELQQAILKDYCVHAGVFDALSAMYGVEFNKVGYTLHISHPGDKWYEVYSDLGLPVAKTGQMHYDLGYEVPKAMVYMNDVDESNGPFSLYPNSHTWEDLGFWLSLRKQWTYALIGYAKEKGLPTFSLNSSPFRHKEVRQAFGSMPREIRSTGHIGDHIPDDSPLSRDLLAGEKQITGEAGTLAIFTGGHTIHRGGIAKQGERWALQVCFWPKNKIKLPSKEDLEKSGLREPKTEKPKGFFGSLFGSKASAPDSPKKKLESQPVTQAAAPAANAPAAAAKPAYSNQRFGKALKQILGDDLQLTLADVGGAGNLQPHWHRFHQVADFVVYEPHPGSYKALMERQVAEKYYKRFHYRNEALSGTGGERTLYITNTPTGSSLLPPKKGSIGDYPGNSYFFPVVEEKIQTTTLHASLTDAGFPAVHGIKLDTQGTEFEIIRGLSPDQLKALLFVEMEISVSQSYEGSDTSLETVIPWMRDLGLELMDLRTNRSLGNGRRLGKDKLDQLFGPQRSTPAISQRLVEVDGIFIRDPRDLLDAGTDRSTLLRLISILCGYGLFTEAAFAADYAAEKAVIPSAEAEAISTIIKSLVDEVRLEVADFEAELKSRNNQNWAQYMWVPYPSA